MFHHFTLHHFKLSFEQTKDDVNHESYLHVLIQLDQRLCESSLGCHTHQTKYRDLLDKEVTHRLRSSNSNTLHAVSDVPHQTVVGILFSKNN